MAILSKHPAQSCWSEDWKNFGKIDPPRGFVFAHFKIDGKNIAVYGVHFKSNLSMRGDPFKGRQLNILKRELSAEQLIAHINHLPVMFGHEFETIIIAGDFNTNKDQVEFASENTLKILEKNGFASGFDDIHPSERVTYPSKGKYPDATFDYIYIKSESIPNTIINIDYTTVSDHNPVTLTTSIKQIQ